MGRAQGSESEVQIAPRPDTSEPPVELTPPSRVLVAGDVHMDTQAIEYLSRMAVKHGCQAILQVGDFGFWSHHEEGKRFLRKSSRLLKSAGVELYFIDGNHESFGVLWGTPWRGAGQDGFKLISERIYYIPRGSRWQWQGVNFLAMGGAYSVDKDIRLHEERKRRKLRSAWWAEETITDEQVEQALAGGGPVDILVCHDCPWNVDLRDRKSPDYKYDLDTELNRRQLQKLVDATEPKLIFHGHWHRRHSNPYYNMARQLLVPVEGLGMNGMGEDSWYVLDLDSFGS